MSESNDFLPSVEQLPMFHYGEVNWRLWLDKSVRDPSAQVVIDQRLLERVVAGDSPSVIRVWRNTPAIVVSRTDSRMPSFQHAVDVLGQEGWPVIIRTTGGTAVVHGPGILNVSLCYAMPAQSAFSIEASYRLLCQLCCDLLCAQGVNATVSSVPGAFCDGAYNVAVGDKKIAGTAQRVSKRGGRTAVLAHLSLLVDTDVKQFCRQLEHFYRLAGVPKQLPPDKVTSLQQTLDSTMGVVQKPMLLLEQWFKAQSKTESRYVNR